MFKTIFSKIFTGLLITALSISLLTLFFSFKTIRHHYIQTLTRNLDSLIISMLPETETMLAGKDLERLSSKLLELEKRTHFRFTVVDGEGKVLADSEKDPLSMGNHKSRSEIARALKGETGSSIRFSSTLNEELLYVAKPVKLGGGRSGAFRASIFLKDINVLLGELKRNIIGWTALITLFALAGAYIFARKISIPIKELTRAAGIVASGDYGAKVRITGGGELKSLGSAFNAMSDEISKNFNEADNRRRELEAVISSIQDALLVFGRDGRIKYSNGAFTNDFGKHQADGFYWESLRSSVFEDMVKRVLRDRPAGVKEEIEINGKAYICGISAVPGREEYIAVFHDITHIRQMDRMKKDLVTNVSHELRTPLTAIKGFTETLEDNTEGDENKAYCRTVARHTDRLIKIVEDLLLLSNLEEQGFRLDTSKVDLKKLAEEAVSIFEAKIKEKGIEVKLETADAPVLEADAFKIEQVLINLIDNALKYTEKGWIRIGLTQRENNALIEIEDTGPGIPEEHIPRIFERFYVVDKSRSRKLGGTGLGLAIVKHIVTLHNGTISVSSAPGRGTKFSVSLPFRQ